MKKILDKKNIKIISLIVILIFIVIIAIFEIQNNRLTKNDYTNRVNSYLSKNTHWYTNNATELNNGFDLKIDSKNIIYKKNDWEAVVNDVAYANSDGYIPKPKNNKLSIVFKNKINDHDIELQLNKIGFLRKNPFPDIKSGTFTISDISSTKFTRNNHNNFDIDLTKIRAKIINFPLAYLNIVISKSSTFSLKETAINNKSADYVSEKFNTLPAKVEVTNINNPGNSDDDFKAPLALIGNNIILNTNVFFIKSIHSKYLKCLDSLVITNENLVINWFLK